MDQGSAGPPTEFPDHPGEDTIELQLTGEQILAIGQAAEESQTQAHSLEPLPGSSSGERAFGLSPAVQGRVIRLAARSDLVCGLTLVTAVVIGMTLVVSRPANPPPPMAAVTSPPLVISPPAPVAEPEERPSVHVRNPFDATEVFEFPAGISRTEARAAVAELLLKRARDRRDQDQSTGLTAQHRSRPNVRHHVVSAGLLTESERFR
jgi:hypothetical protein